jgi:hypothetical protein
LTSKLAAQNNQYYIFLVSFLSLLPPSIGAWKFKKITPWGYTVIASIRLKYLTYFSLDFPMLII